MSGVKDGLVLRSGLPKLGSNLLGLARAGADNRTAAKGTWVRMG
jgi:hypothetical protein